TELSGVCFMNETYLLRCFKNFFGITPRQYLIKKRMEAASQMLQSRRNLLITEICFNVGYDDLSSFSKLFKKYFRLSPEAYRRKSHS
ncbi:MAG: helix-turn-helix transcriptional regulator, partial [Flavisolibacter sp.]